MNANCITTALIQLYIDLSIKSHGTQPRHLFNAIFIQLKNIWSANANIFKDVQMTVLSLLKKLLYTRYCDKNSRLWNMALRPPYMELFFTFHVRWNISTVLIRHAGGETHLWTNAWLGHTFSLILQSSSL